MSLPQATIRFLDDAIDTDWVLVDVMLRTPQGRSGINREYLVENIEVEYTDGADEFMLEILIEAILDAAFEEYIARHQAMKGESF